MAKFLDGCHRYGWAINLILTLILFAYFMGGINTSIINISSRLVRVEATLDRILMDDR